MTVSFVTRAVGVGAAAFASIVLAQAPAPRAAPTVVPLDRVIAVVNDEALTQWDLREQKRILLEQLKASNVQAPSTDVLDKQVLERLITERALTQFAKETGIRVDDTIVERTILRIAEENKLSPDEFRKVLEKENIPYANYREDIRRQVLMQRLRDREVDSKILVTDAEVDNYLATVASQAGGEREYLLAHIYVTVPEQASADQIETRRRRAEDALTQIKGGKEFAEVAASFSDAPDATSGGSLGWRTAARLPSIFTEPAQKMKAGDVSNVLRSPAGFHIFKVVEMRSRDQPTVVDQSHARHILVKVNETSSETEAKLKIERLRERITGGAKFDDLARVNSEDATSAKGGDLGWISPGDTVPDFERAMNKLAVNELSPVVRTPFGWHLIEVIERRKQDITLERRREQARRALRERKSDEQFQEFVRQTRDRAYVEYKIDER
ncbi:MAG TPA: peptidylprolyl isomerase [Casimicrobiaceae bacterium]|jgi:peptidyl-prolyl cis-trans isomerase SurA